MGSRPLAVAPLHLGSPWRSAAERLGASSLGFDLARYRHDPPRTGRRAHRLGLARLDAGGRRPGLRACWLRLAEGSPTVDTRHVECRRLADLPNLPKFGGHRGRER